MILTILRFFTKKITKSSKIRNYFICSLLIGLIFKNMFVIAFNYKSNYLLQIFEFLVIMIYLRFIREAWKRIFMVMWQSIQIIIIIIAYIIFFALVGFILFNDNKFKYNDPYGYFVTIRLSLFNTYVLFTTSNFPDIIFPFWKVNNMTSLYFISFLFFGLYIIFNFFLATIYISYTKLEE